MDTFIEIMRRVRLLWALCWIAGTLALVVYSPAWVPLRIGAPTLAWLALYLAIPGPWRAALCWIGVMLSLALVDDLNGGRQADFFMLFAPWVGAGVILAAGYLLAPLFRRRA